MKIGQDDRFIISLFLNVVLTMSLISIYQDYQKKKELKK
tara:strand:- start:9018 stop:9134 length:117 start_codon:yes stop_codon:yes gene_type:complete